MFQIWGNIEFKLIFLFLISNTRYKSIIKNFEKNKYFGK